MSNQLGPCCRGHWWCFWMLLLKSVFPTGPGVCNASAWCGVSGEHINCLWQNCHEQSCSFEDENTHDDQTDICCHRSNRLQNSSGLEIRAQRPAEWALAAGSGGCWCSHPSPPAFPMGALQPEASWKGRPTQARASEVTVSLLPLLLHGGRACSE